MGLRCSKVWVQVKILHGEIRAELVGGKSPPLEPARLLRFAQRQGASWTICHSAMQRGGRRPRVHSQRRSRPRSKKNGQSSPSSRQHSRRRSNRARSCSFVHARERLPEAAQGSSGCIRLVGRHRRQSQGAEDTGAASACGGSAGNVQRGWRLSCRVWGGTWPRSCHS